MCEVKLFKKNFHLGSFLTFHAMIVLKRFPKSYSMQFLRVFASWQIIRSVTKCYNMKYLKWLGLLLRTRDLNRVPNLLKTLVSMVSVHKPGRWDQFLVSLNVSRIEVGTKLDWALFVLRDSDLCRCPERSGTWVMSAAICCLDDSCSCLRILLLSPRILL